MLEGRLDCEADDVVRFSYTVTNGSDEPANITFRDSGKADVAVFDEDDREVWRWSAGQMFMQVIQEATLEPGESATFEFEWEDPDPGEYRACANLRAQGEDCETETDLSV